MKIGIDLSPIQGPHRMRGIGYTLINLINHLPAKDRKKHEFVFYTLPEESADFGDPLDILDLHGMNYEIRPLTPQKKIVRRLPGRLNLVISSLNALLAIKDLRFGDSRISDTKDLDVFLQTDQSQSLPAGRRLKKVLIVYDIIPYVLEWDYLWSYKTARQIHGFSRKAAFRCKTRRWLYIFKLKLNIRRADKILAISEVTKNDFISTYNINRDKIFVTPLGVSRPTVHSKDITLKRYFKTSWGYQTSPLKLSSSQKFLLFVGGADKRRKLQDLVTVFNNLRASGKDIKLVLAGDSMKGPEAISTEEIQGALKTSSYLNDIIFLGFIDDISRDWLYKHALAYVFPIRYEGFGLPVLEAMSYGCPVISYKNSATTEVAGNAPLYVENTNELLSAVQLILESPTKVRQMREMGLKQVEASDWTKASHNIIKQTTT
ncbi:MAG: hypothetical protein QG553_880 [Patescibacteria group bacterium]|nr:hypothetical protein [Patescibacteria group bacterium]